uniref:Uncharacterized protein n=1 Tax=Anguilla anguilla TaxID=7936 RepID=A0A0E9S1M3_ANGAN
MSLWDLCLYSLLPSLCLSACSAGEIRLPWWLAQRSPSGWSAFNTLAS